MKQFFNINIVLALVAVLFFSSCEAWNTPEKTIVHPSGQLGMLGDHRLEGYLPFKEFYTEREEAYLKNLRDYKATMTERELAFGWQGGWTAKGTSNQHYLSCSPDSMDIIAIWSSPLDLSPEQIADLEFVRKKKGTKVVFTFILSHVGRGLNNEDSYKGMPLEDAIKQYAKDIADLVVKYNYDGFDIDFEPGGDPQSQAAGIFNKRDNVMLFIESIGKYLGPKATEEAYFYKDTKKPRMLLVDGELVLLPPECGLYFDYFIAQAYYCREYDNLEGRAGSVNGRLNDFDIKKFIVTEDFESGWRIGGVDFYDKIAGKTIPSLFGMALWKPTSGERKGGFGAYHMEYECLHPDKPDYYYMRQAIQLVNPVK